MYKYTNSTSVDRSLKEQPKSCAENTLNQQHRRLVWSQYQAVLVVCILSTALGLLLQRDSDLSKQYYSFCILYIVHLYIYIHKLYYTNTANTT